MGDGKDRGQKSEVGGQETVSREQGKNGRSHLILLVFVSHLLGLYPKTKHHRGLARLIHCMMPPSFRQIRQVRYPPQIQGPL